MATVNSLAQEYDMEPYGLRAFADGLLDCVFADDAAIPAGVEATVREALEAGPVME